MLICTFCLYLGSGKATGNIGFIIVVTITSTLGIVIVITVTVIITFVCVKKVSARVNKTNNPDDPLSNVEPIYDHLIPIRHTVTEDDDSKWFK